MFLNTSRFMMDYKRPPAPEGVALRSLRIRHDERSSIDSKGFRMEFLGSRRDFLTLLAGALPAMLLETPKGEGKATGPIVVDPLDQANLNTLRRLIK